MMRRLCSIAMLGVMVAACSDEQADCTPAAPCTTSPPDLAITSVSILSTNAPAHPVTGHPVVDSIRVRYVVRNLGDSIAPPVRASVILTWDQVVRDSLPALQPHDSIVRIVTVPHKQIFYTYYESFPTTNVNVQLDAPLTDPQHNNYVYSNPVHLRLPVLEVTMLPVAEPRIRVNDPFQLTVTITNHSPDVAARDIQLRHCLWDYDVACWDGNWTAFGNVPLPDIGPGETRTFTYTTAITPTAMGEGFWYYGLTACVTSRADTSVYRDYNSVGNDTWICAGGGEIDVWPDYEACAPPVLSAQPATLNAPNCGIYPVPSEPGNWEFEYRWKLYYVFALDAQPGQSYRVTGLEHVDVKNTMGKPAVDVDPADDRVAFEHAGRYYFIMYSPSGSITMSAVAVP